MGRGRKFILGGSWVGRRERGGGGRFFGGAGRVVGRLASGKKISRFSISKPGFFKTAVNANPRLQVNPKYQFFFCKNVFTSYVLCSLRLFKLKTEGH